MHEVVGPIMGSDILPPSNYLKAYSSNPYCKHAPRSVYTVRIRAMSKDFNLDWQIVLNLNGSV